MKIAYIAMPYRADTPRGIVENIRRAEEVAIKYWKLGYFVLCPHKNTALFDGILPDDVWLKAYLVILKKCDVIVMGPGWENAEGAVDERDSALQNGIEVIYE